MSFKKKAKSAGSSAREAPSVGLLSDAGLRPDLEAGTSSTAVVSDDGGEKLVRDNIKKILNRTSNLNALIYQVKTGDEKVVSKLNAEIEAIRNLTQKTESNVLELEPENPNDGPTRKSEKRMRYMKLQKSIETAVKEFEDASRRGLDALQELKKNKSGQSASDVALMAEMQNDGDDGKSADIDEEAPGRFASDSLVLAAADLKFNEELLADREENIRGIQQDIQGINTLYKELSYHVGAQGEQLDTIEQNMQNTVDTTEQAAEQIQISETYQRSRTKRYACILFGLAVFIAIIVIVAFTSH